MFRNSCVFVVGIVGCVVWSMTYAHVAFFLSGCIFFKWWHYAKISKRRSLDASAGRRRQGMKTIEQIFKDNGSVFPFKVCMDTWPEGRFYKFVATSPRRKWMGWDENGLVVMSGNEDSDWILYKEPKPTKKLYPYLIWGSFEKRYVEINYFKDEEYAKQCCSSLYIGPHPILEPIEIGEL